MAKVLRNGQVIDVPDSEFVVDPAVEEARAAREVRSKRNSLLASTDWLFRSDMTPSQAWIDYCQALRDITQQSGFPHDVIWPTAPA